MAKSDAERTHQYVGSVRKCPACGEDIPSFTAVCPTCGHELNSIKLSPSLSGFMKALQECDTNIAQETKDEKWKNGWGHWSKCKRMLWVILNLLTSCIPLVIYLTVPLIKPLFSESKPILSPKEKEKASIIENYSFPNERKTILETLLFTKEKAAFLASEKYTDKTVYWMRLWSTKAEQLQQKASFLLKGDPIAVAAYEEIRQSKARLVNRMRIRAAIGAGIIIIFILVIVLNGSLLHNLGKIASRIGGNNFEWLESGLSTNIPTLDANRGNIYTNSDVELHLRLEGVSYNRFESYVVSCQEMGYTVQAQKDTNSYTAHNSEGYLLDLFYVGDDLEIELKAPLIGDENFVWPDHRFAPLLPKLNGKTGTVETANDDCLEFTLYDVSASEAKAYFESCKNAGFSYDVQSEETYYNGYNVDGYELSITYNEMKAMSISLKTPRVFTEIAWPNSGPATLIPKPPSSIGAITSDYDWVFSASIGEMNIEAFNRYVDACIENGFEKDTRRDDYFTADKGESISLTIQYTGFNIISIHIYDYDAFQ